jgi:hypothetical protein
VPSILLFLSPILESSHQLEGILENQIREKEMLLSSFQQLISQSKDLLSQNNSSKEKIIELENQIIAIMKSKETVNNAILYSLNEERRKNSNTRGMEREKKGEIHDHHQNHQLSFFAKQLQDDSILQHELCDNSNPNPNPNPPSNLRQIQQASLSPAVVTSFPLKSGSAVTPTSQEEVIMDRISRGDYDWLNDDAIIQSLLTESFQQNKEIEVLTSQNQRNSLKAEECTSLNEISDLKMRNEQERGRVRQSNHIEAFFSQQQGHLQHPQLSQQRHNAAVEVPSVLLPSSSPLPPPPLVSSIQNDSSSLDVMKQFEAIYDFIFPFSFCFFHLFSRFNQEINNSGSHRPLSSQQNSFPSQFISHPEVRTHANDRDKQPKEERRNPRVLSKERGRDLENEEVNKRGIINNLMNLTFTSNSFVTNNSDKIISYSASSASPPSSASSLSSSSSTHASSSHPSRPLSLGSQSPVIDQLTAYLASSSAVAIPSSTLQAADEVEAEEMSPQLTATAVLTVHSSANSSVASKESKNCFGHGDQRSHSTITSMKERHLLQQQQHQQPSSSQGLPPLPHVLLPPPPPSSSSVHSFRSYSSKGSEKEKEKHEHDDDNVSSSTGNWSFSYVLQHGSSKQVSIDQIKEKNRRQQHILPFRKEIGGVSSSRSYDNDDDEEERDSLDLIQLAKMDS